MLIRPISCILDQCERFMMTFILDLGHQPWGGVQKPDKEFVLNRIP